MPLTGPAVAGHRSGGHRARCSKVSLHARLACGCRITFREGVEGSPVLVVVADKSPQCASTLHVAGLPVFDTRESLRPSTRLGPPEEEEYEEEG